MTRDEIKQMVNTCDSYYGCGCCPYNPEDISRFIGDRWKGGCPNYDRKLVYAMGKGYGDIDDHRKQAVKEFAEKIKAKLNAIYGKTICSDLDTEDITDIIDELLKEYENG